MKFRLPFAVCAVAMMALPMALSAAPIFADTLGSGALAVNPSTFSARLKPIISNGLTISGGVNYGFAQFGADQSYLDDPGAISLRFDAPVSAFVFDFTTVGVDLTVSAYDSANHLLESDIFPVSSLPHPEGYPTGLAGMAGLIGISHVVIGTAYGSDSVLIGTVRFLHPAAVVPEPATWAMALVGFGALGATLRRRRPARA